MRIGFVAQPIDTLCPPVEGGSLAIWIYQVARRCSARGHDTFVFANQGAPWRERSLVDEGVTYVYPATALNTAVNRLGRLSRMASRGNARTVRIPEFSAAWRDAGYGTAVGRASSRRGCDVVHVMNYSQLLPRVRRAHPRARICLHMSCEWLTQLDRQTIEARLRCADLIIGCSDYITHSIAERFPTLSGRCVTVPNAVSATDPPDRSLADGQQVLFVGRVSPEKGLHVLIPAFRLVLERFPLATLRIVGGVGSAPLEYLVSLSDDPRVAGLASFYRGPSAGESYAHGLEQAAGPDLGRRIRFEGRMEHSAVGQAYERAAVLVNPSLSEAFGMSLVEAMMHGVPVVASRVGGMVEIVQNGETGLLVESGDVEGLAAALCELLSDPARSRAMGAAGRRAALERYTWDHTTDLLLAQYEEMARSRRA